MDEDVLTAGVRLDEAIALLPVEPLNYPARHTPYILAPSVGDGFSLAQVPGNFLQIFGFAGAEQPTEFVEI
jgi:hypothetical protein